MHDLLERLPELRIEDRIDDRIDEAVHVAQPRGENERRHARIAVGIVQFGAQCVQHVAREERQPADEEDTCAKRNGSGIDGQRDDLLWCRTNESFNLLVFFHSSHSPNTMASVLVAFRSFFADDFSRFFFEALCTLYIVNLWFVAHNRRERKTFISFRIETASSNKCVRKLKRRCGGGE